MNEIYSNTQECGICKFNKFCLGSPIHVLKLYKGLGLMPILPRINVDNTCKTFVKEEKIEQDI